MAYNGRGYKANVTPRMARIRLWLARADILRVSDELVAKELNEKLATVKRCRREGEKVLALPGDEHCILGTKAAGWICGVTDIRIRQFVREGRLKCVPSKSRTIYFRKGDVIEFASQPRLPGIRKNERTEAD